MTNETLFQKRMTAQEAFDKAYHIDPESPETAEKRIALSDAFRAEAEADAAAEAKRVDPRQNAIDQAANRRSATKRLAEIEVELAHVGPDPRTELETAVVSALLPLFRMVRRVEGEAVARNALEREAYALREIVGPPRGIAELRPPLVTTGCVRQNMVWYELSALANAVSAELGVPVRPFSLLSEVEQTLTRQSHAGRRAREILIGLGDEAAAAEKRATAKLAKLNQTKDQKRSDQERVEFDQSRSEAEATVSGARAVLADVDGVARKLSDDARAKLEARDAFGSLGAA